jgi:hypothetical protein
LVDFDGISAVVGSHPTEALLLSSSSAYFPSSVEPTQPANSKTERWLSFSQARNQREEADRLYAFLLEAEWDSTTVA